MSDAVTVTIWATEVCSETDNAAVSDDVLNDALDTDSPADRAPVSVRDKVTRMVAVSATDRLTVSFVGLAVFATAPESVTETAAVSVLDRVPEEAAVSTTDSAAESVEVRTLWMDADSTTEIAPESLPERGVEPNEACSVAETVPVSVAVCVE